jgi:hypothetical protein
MKRLLIIQIIILFSYNAYNQTSIGADINIGGSYFHLNGESPIVNGFYDTYEPKYNYHASIFSTLSLTSKVNISLGLGLLSLGDKTSTKLNIPDFPYDVVNITNNFKYLTIPIRIEHQLYSKKLQYYINYGFSPQIFLNHQLTTKSYKDDVLVNTTKRSDKEEFRTYNVSFYIGNKIQYPIHKKLDLLFSLGLEGQILPTVQSETLDFRYYLISLGTGIALKI